MVAMSTLTSSASGRYQFTSAASMPSSRSDPLFRSNSSRSSVAGSANPAARWNSGGAEVRLDPRIELHHRQRVAPRR